jgi:precorrin-2 dehydrogenase/sirohydrochlorin ferrochelatase
LLPISIDLARIRVLLIGDGAAALRRLRLLDEAGAGNLEVYALNPMAGLTAAAGERLRRHLPAAADIGRAQLVFAAGVPEPAAATLRRMATDAGVLLNVEDDPARCDFHSTAVLRRGDLTIAVSTNGRSPGLAVAVRRELEQLFGPEWQDRLDRLAVLRAQWLSEGADHRTIADRTVKWLERERSG